MTTNIKWRLSKLPDTEEVSLLVEKGILTKDEAREILFSLETEDTRSEKSLQEEIKFLRELVQKLTTSRSVIVENIKLVQKPYTQSDWYQPYYAFATNAGTQGNMQYMTTTNAGATQGMLTTTSGISAMNLQTSNQATTNFTDIKTF